MKIDLGRGEKGKTEIDINELIKSRLLIQANSGGGKSYTLRRILEKSHGKVQQIVLDLEGEFVTLREKFDYVLVGKGGDIPISIRTAEMLARRLLELNVSAIIDMSELQKHERILFVKRFLDALIEAPKNLRHPCLVIVDEAHQFCPEGGKSESASSVIDLCTRGRKRGLSAVLATQRISKLSKDAAAECNNKLIGRTGLDVDMKRASDELGYSSKEQMLALRQLQPGEFIAFGPAISNEPVKLKVGKTETTHYEAGQTIKEAPVPTSVVRKALEKLADLPKEVEEELRTADDFKRKIAELKRENTMLKNASPQRQQVSAGFVNRQMMDVQRRHKIELQQIEKVWHDKYRAVLKSAENNAAQIIAKAQKFSFDLVTDVSDAGRVTKRKAVFLYHLTGIDVKRKFELPKDTYGIRIPKMMTKSTQGVVKEAVIYDEIISEGDFSKSQQAILDVLAEFLPLGFEDVPKPMLAALTKTSPTSGGYFNNLGKLRTAGMIEYRKSGTVHITDAGLGAAKPQETPITTEELQDRWMGLLSSSQKKILQVLIEVYPENISKNELAERTGASSTSGGFFNNLGGMRTMGVLEYPSAGMVKASKNVFLEELR